MPRARLKNFHGQVVETLGSQIVGGQLAEGTRLPTEPQLAESLGASRLVIREAMKVLAAKGLVSIRPRTGTHVLPRSHWNLFDATVLAWHANAPLDDKLVADLMELRRAIEPVAARLAAQRGTADDLVALRGAYEAMAAADNQADYIAADLHFHGAVMRACGNQFIRQLEGALSEVLKTSFQVSSGALGAEPRALKLHEALLLALEAHDPSAADAAVQALIERAAERIHAAGQQAAAPPR